MTNDLAQRLRDFVILEDIELAADRIEALTAENERLRELLVRGYVVCDGNDDDAVAFRTEARAALGDTQ